MVRVELGEASARDPRRGRTLAPWPPSSSSTLPSTTRPCRPTAATARTADRRPRLRLRRPPPRAPPPRHHTRDRPPQTRTRLRPRPLPLGRRAHLRLATPLQTAARPLRTPPRHPPRVPRTRLLPRLLPPTQQLIVKGVLRFPAGLCRAEPSAQLPRKTGGIPPKPRRRPRQSARPNVCRY